MQYAVIIERSETGFAAYVPDLPGCVAAAATEQEVLELVREAIEFHLDGLRDDGHPPLAPSARVEYVDVQSAA